MLNEFFANARENLNNCLTRLARIDTGRVMKLAQTVMDIELTWTKVHKEIDKQK